MLRFMGSQRVGHDWATELNWDAIKLPKEVAVIHCQGHQRDDSDTTVGNRRANQQVKKKKTKKAAIQSFNTQAPLLWNKIPSDIKSQYSPEKGQHSPLDGLHTEDEKLVLPYSTQWKILKTLQQAFLLGIENMYQPAKSLFKGKGLIKAVSQIAKGCEVCQKNNPC